MKKASIYLITLFMLMACTVQAQLICSGCATGTPDPVLPAGGGTYSNAIVLTKEAVFTITGSGDFYLTGVISENGGSFGLTIKAPDAKLFLSATHTYTGATTVESGQLGGPSSLVQSAATIGDGAVLFGGTGAGNPGTLTVKSLTLSAKTATIAVYASALALSLIKAGADGKGELTAAAGGTINIMDPLTLAEGDYPIILAKTVAKDVSDFTINRDKSGCCMSVIQTVDGIYLRIRRVTITGNAVVCAGGEAVLTATGLGITNAAHGGWSSQSIASVRQGNDDVTEAKDNPATPGKSKTSFQLADGQSGTVTATFKLSDCNAPFNYTLTMLPEPTVFFSPKASIGISAGVDLEHSPGIVHIDVEPEIEGTQFTWQALQSEGSGDLQVSKEGTLKSLPKVEEATWNAAPQTDPIVFKVAATVGTMRDLILKVYPQLSFQGTTCKGASKTVNVPVRARWITAHVPGGLETSNESGGANHSGSANHGAPVAVCSGDHIEIKIGDAGDGNLYGWYRRDRANLKEEKAQPVEKQSATILKETLTASGTQSENVYYYITSTNGTCEVSTAVPVVVYPVPPPEITGILTKSPVCSNSDADIKLTSNVTPEEKDRISYTWTVSENKVGAVSESTGVRQMPPQILINPEIMDQSVVYTFTPYYNYPNSEIACQGKPATSEVLVKGIFKIGTITGLEATEICKGAEPFSLSIATVGKTALQYQWMKDETPIEKANTASYQISPAEISSGSYTVKVSSQCEDKTSAPKLLKVIETFTTGSITGTEATAVCIGAESPSLLITPVGNKNLQYQWMKDRVPIKNATTASYKVPTGEISSARYTVKVSSQCESKISEDKLLNVIETFTIGSIAGAEATAVCMGAQSPSLSITPAGNKTLQYQWMKDGSVIENANTASYQIPTSEISSGSYTVKVSSECEAKTSAPKLLNVIETFTIGSITGVDATAVCMGAESPSLSITPAGNKTVQYRWMKDGTPIENATTASYLIPTSKISSGSYTVKVSSECEAKTSAPKLLNVIETFTIGSITGVEATAVCMGAELPALSITPAGNKTLQYQWMKDGSVIENATTASYQIPTGEISSARYTVKVSSQCEDKISEPKLLNVIETFTIGSITGVEATAVCMGAESPSLSITPAGNKTLQYQWMKDGSAIANANTASYQIPTGEISSARYTVKVSSQCEAKTSAPKLLNVIETFTIGSIAGVEASAVCMGAESPSLSIAPAGNKTLQYQWMKDGAAIANANTASYQIPTGEISTGSYTVEVSSQCEAQTSAPKLLNVIETFTPGSIMGVEASAVCMGTQSASLYILPSGNKTLQYQWMKDGTPIANANTASYQIPTGEISSASYAVKVSSECEAKTTEPKLLNVIETFTIGSITGVDASSVCMGTESASLSIIPAGNKTLQYQWMKDGSFIANANTASYQIPTDEISSGRYTVKVSSECEEKISAPKFLNVIETFTIGSITGVEATAVCMGTQSPSLSIASDGNKTLQYRWMKDGSFIANANTASYRIPTGEISSGRYTVKVSSECEEKISDPKFLNVIETFKIGSITGVEESAVCLGDQIAPLSIVPHGNGALHYQWMKDGTNIANANTASYQIPTGEISSGWYTVKVSSECETKTSAPKLLNVTSDAYFVNEHASVLADPTEGGGLVKFTYTGPAAIYSWDFNDNTPVFSRQNPVHTYYQAGTWTPVLTVVKSAAQTQCNMKFALVIENNKALTGDIERRGITVYPVPAKDQVTISSREELTGIMLSDASGRNLIHEEACGHEKIILLSTLSPGLYMLDIITRGEVKRVKIIKE